MTALLRQRDELVGWQKTVGRMLPAHQSLEAAQLQRPHIDLRLIDQLEFVPLKREPQIGLDVSAYAARYARQVHTVHPDASLAQLGLDPAPRAIIDAVWKKEEGHLINRPGFVRPARSMSQIGG